MGPLAYGKRRVTSEGGGEPHHRKMMSRTISRLSASSSIVVTMLLKRVRVTARAAGRFWRMAEPLRRAGARRPPDDIGRSTGRNDHPAGAIERAFVQFEGEQAVALERAWQREPGGPLH